MNLITLLPTIFSIISALVAAFAGHKANQAHRALQGGTVTHPRIARRRGIRSLVFGLGPNDNAGPADIANKLDGIDGATGQALSYRLWAFGYEAHAFGLSKDYAFPEGPNVSASMPDGVTTLVKSLGRARTLADKNQYLLWEMCLASAKAALRTYPDLMDDEPLSVNYKPAAKTTEDLESDG